MAKRLVSYDRDWPVTFSAMAAQIREAFERPLPVLHPMGSTAVPGLAAKPVIDILGEVSALNQAERAGAKLSALGFEARGEYGMAGRRYFSKPEGETLACHLHIYEAGSPQIARHLRFRDYLIAHAPARDAYAAFKWSLARADGTLPADYQARKLSFVTQMEAEALAYFTAKPDHKK